METLAQIKARNEHLRKYGRLPGAAPRRYPLENNSRVEIPCEVSSPSPETLTTQQLRHIERTTGKTKVTWAYGITTVPERRDELLPRTLKSLESAGFPSPRLFVDGDDDVHEWRSRFGLEVTCRYPTIRTYGNWVLGLAELYIREPRQTYYAMFQDDLVAYKNLRGYLEAVPYPENGYLNLYTFPKNQVLAGEQEGFYPSNQKGLGAVALVFSAEAVVTLLTHQHMVVRPKDVMRGHKAIDGGIVTAMRHAGYKEFVHNPSLVQHTGKRSSMRNREHPLAPSFRGEEYDALSLIPLLSSRG